MASINCFFVLSVLCCCLHVVTPQMMYPRRNMMAMSPMEGMGMMGGYAAVTYPRVSAPPTAEERATLFVKLFECGSSGMPPCDTKYAASLASLFHNIASNIESKMKNHMIAMRHAGLGPRSRTMTESLGTRGLFGDKWEALKGWFISQIQ